MTHPDDFILNHTNNNERMILLKLYFPLQDSYNLLLDENGKIPEGYFQPMGYSIFVSEALAQEYIDRNDKISRALVSRSYTSIESIDINIPQNAEYIYQVVAWIHENSDKRFGYVCSHPHATESGALLDKLWIDTIDTVVNRNTSEIRSEFNGRHYYENIGNFMVLKDIGSEHPFGTLDGKFYLNYNASIRKIKIVRGFDEIDIFR